MSLQGKRVAMLVEQEFEDPELAEPKQFLENKGAQVILIGNQITEYQGKQGKTTVRADRTADEADASDFDLLVVPGGHAPDKMRLHEDMVAFVRAFDAAGKPIAAICHGPQLLIEADVVRGRTLTSWPSVRTDLKNAGANWVDQPVVTDRNLITSRKPDDIPQFNQAIEQAFAREPATAGAR